MIVTVTPVKDASGAVSRALVVLRDVTREEALEERLRVAAKLEAVGTMASGIAHDFNNLLQPILASAEEIRQLVPTDHPTVARALDIEASATRGRGLVRRLLTFTRDVELPRVPTPLAAVGDEALRLTERLRAATIRVTASFAGDAWVLADAAELHHVVVNLITNACDAMPQGGDLRLTARRDSNTVLLTVADTGSGMDETTRSRMFVPFFSTKAPGRGSGLGLATVPGTITALGGTIDVTSATDRGTTITIRSPAIDAPTPVAPVTAPTDDPPPATTRTVLLVDDDDAVRRAIARMLVRLGYAVLDHSDPRDTVALLSATPRAAHLVLTDLSMPHLSGIELAAAVHALTPTLPVVLMTGMVDTEHADAARANGIAAVVAKPFTQHELHQVVMATLDGHAAPIAVPSVGA